jgi:parallel beta-helix repeat protein
MKDSHPSRHSSLALALLLFSSSFLTAQGPLTPPGAPGPTMKTLTQIEPRTPLAQPAPGGFPIVISAPGSYYLTENITGTVGKNGIQVNASGVTIDLNGFEIFGYLGDLDSAITAPAAISNLTIRNGVVRGWSFRALELQNVTSGRIDKLTVSGCANWGVWTGANAVVSDSIFTGNAVGIIVGDGSVLTHCAANGNSAEGFGGGSGVTFTACSVYQNGQGGISGQTGCVVTQCSVFDNGGTGIRLLYAGSVVGCAVHGNGGDGIVADIATVVRDNGVYANAGDNIEVGTDTLVINNTSTGAGFNTGDGAGIHVTGGRNRIEGNNITTCDRGIDVDQAGNTILNNTVRSNPFTGAPANYVIVAGNQVNILLTHLPEVINIPATITFSGDLTGVSGSAGLTIAADNVSVDLAGHALVGVAGSLDGIVISGSRANVTVTNGTIRNWGEDGVDGTTLTSGRFENLTFANNTARGIMTGTRASISKCTARENGAAGITAGQVTRIFDCSGHSNVGFGIVGADNSTIERCLLNNNGGGGLSVTNYSVIRENTADFHTGDAGIFVSGTDNRIEGNQVTRNARGFDIGAAGNLIIKNSASDNTGAGTPSANYDFNGFSQTNGAIITATGTIAADPWANFSF